MGAQGRDIEANRAEYGRSREGFLEEVMGKLQEFIRHRQRQGCNRKKEKCAKAWQRGEVVPEAKAHRNPTEATASTAQTQNQGRLYCLPKSLAMKPHS